MNKIYLRKAKCVQCLRVNKNGKQAYSCDDDPSCAEGSIEIILGHDPKIIKNRVYNKLTAAFESDDLGNFEAFLSVLNSENLTKSGLEAAFEGFKDTVGDLLETSIENERVEAEETEMLNNPENSDTTEDEVIKESDLA